VQLITELRKEINTSTQSDPNLVKNNTKATKSLETNIDILFSQIYHLGDVILSGYKEQLALIDFM
jgi:hypothetical protein